MTIHPQKRQESPALGLLLALAGDKQRALHLAQEAIDAARGLPARPVLAMTLTRAAETAILVGEFRRAAGILIELLGVLTDLGTQRWLAEALETAALVLDAKQDAERASTILGAADQLRDAAQVQSPNRCNMPATGWPTRWVLNASPYTRPVVASF